MPPPLESCANCKFFRELSSTDQPGKGLCLVDPPRRSDNRTEFAVDDGRWPLCFDYEWCGRWERA